MRIAISWDRNFWGRDRIIVPPMRHGRLDINEIKDKIVDLHCIAEIRAHWVETKPFDIDNPRHHYQIASQCRLCLYSRGGKIF